MSELMIDNSGFAAGTLVHIAEGWTPIQDVKAGDMVLSKPENGIGAQVYKPVLRTVQTDNVPVRLIKCILKEVVDQAKKDWRTIEDDELTNIVVTANYPFWVVGKGWVQAEDLRDGYIFELANAKRAEIFGGNGGAFTSARPIYHFPNDPSGWIIMWNEYGDDESVNIADVDLTPGVMRQRDTGVPYREDYVGWYKDNGQPYTCTVYDLELADNSSYYVADLGVLVTSHVITN